MSRSTPVAALGPTDLAVAARPDAGRATVALVVCLVASGTVVVGRDRLGALPVPVAARLTIVVVVACLVACLSAQRRGVWACSSVYLLTLAAFHFGTALLLAGDVSFSGLRAEYDFGWLDRYPMSEVLVLATFGTASCATGVAGVTLVAAWRPGRPDRPARPGGRTDAPDAGANAADLRAPAGLAILTVAAATMLTVVVSSGGLDLLVGSYSDLWATLGHPLVPYAMFGIGFGFVLAVSGQPGRWRVAALVVFGIYAAFALPLGLRGEVLFPSAAAAAVAARRRVAVRGVVVVVGVVLLLALIGGLRQIRQEGLARADLTAVSFSPADGAAELGASIRPVGAVLRWRALGLHPTTPGETFVGQLTRLVSGRILGQPQPPEFSDLRLFNVLVLHREGPIGGSPIAESYYNFGLAGVAVVMIAIGWLVGWLDVGRRPATDTACVAVLPLLLVQVRNEAGSVPLFALLGFSLLALVSLAERRTSAGRPGLPGRLGSLTSTWLPSRRPERPPTPASASLLVVQDVGYGQRLAYFGHQADAEYWDQLWEGRPADYSRAREGHLPRHLRLTFRRYARPGGRVLEAGCGQAQFSVAAAALGFESEAVDWAPRTVERLRAAAPELLVSIGDVRALGGPDGRYDAVYSPGVCEHFEAGPEAVLRETYRVLAPGGVAIVSTPCFSPLLGWLVRRRRGRRGPPGPVPAALDPSGLEFYQYAFTPAGLSAVLRGCGFEVVDVRPYGAFVTMLDYTRPGRWLGARVPRRAMFGLEVAMDVAGLSRWMGRACVWVARRPVGDLPPSRRPAGPTVAGFADDRERAWT